MGRAPCCSDHEWLKRGPWTAEEDQKLIHYIQSHGLGNWSSLPKLAGLSRCGKSCRLRWTNYLRPDIKRGDFSMDEDLTIISLHGVLGNRWSTIASHLHGRTDNEIKNHWNTKLKKRLRFLGIDPVTHVSLPTVDMLSSFMAPSSTAKAALLNGALFESQLGRPARDYVNISHDVTAGRADYQYWWQLSQILKLLGTRNNHPLGSLSSISTDQFLQTDALRWRNSSSENNMNQGSTSGQKNDFTEYNAFSQESLQFSNLEMKPEGKNLPFSTDHGSEHMTASSLIEDQTSSFDTEIVDWNSMPILMPSSNPDKKDNLPYYSDKQSTNSLNGGSEILENTIQYCQDVPFGPAIRSSDLIMSLPATSADVQEEESNYWIELLNSNDDSNPELSLPTP